MRRMYFHVLPELTPLTLDVFLGDLLFFTVGFITIFHHHLGEYFWNFFKSSERANPS